MNCMILRALSFVLILFPAMETVAVTCDNPSTQLQMNQCAAQELVEANEVLNNVYNEVRNRLSNAQKVKLRKSQLAWIKFRDLDCAFESSASEEGSAHGLITQNCLIRKTKNRIGEFKEMLHCPEGDLGCPAS